MTFINSTKPHLKRLALCTQYMALNKIYSELVDVVDQHQQPIGKSKTPLLDYTIHPKRWFPRLQESTDNFEFSAEGLSENAKSIKITLFAELLTVISPNYVQSLLNLSINIARIANAVQCHS